MTLINNPCGYFLYNLSMNIDLTNVPKKPGVYLWKNKFGNIIYVGKAKNLNSRMKQYFKGMLNSYKTAKLVELIADFEYVITSSEREALILERNLIEKHKPEFNIKLTDDKRYPYVQVKLTDKLEINLIYRIRSTNQKNSLIYGPFPDGFGARKMVNMLNRIAVYKNGLPNKTTDYEFWRTQYEYVKKLLTSKTGQFIKELNRKMMSAAENQQYEIANEIKETISALSFYQENQSVELLNKKDIDVIGVVEKDGYLSIAMLFYRQGMLLSTNNKMIEILESKEESLRQFVSQYYSFNFKPSEIYSNEIFESDISIHRPIRGNSKKILDIAITNAKDNIDLKLKEFIRKEELTIGAVHKLQNLLGLKNIQHILMIDNSNTNNTNPVSAIVSYRNGLKQFSEYRKYNVEVKERAADVDYMKQGVIKYFKNNKYPDLFILDGGKAQFNEIKKLMPDLPIIALVKDDKHTTRSLLNLEGNEINIDDTLLLNFLKGIQKEVDRYAKSAHTKRRMTTLEGILSSVEGVGPATEQKLLDHFKTYSAIYNASIEDLKKVVSEKTAINILERMHND